MISLRHVRTAALLAVCGLGFVLRADAVVKPNALFSSNAVLQRGMPVPVWGVANDGEKVTVEIQGQSASTVAQNGRWMVRLSPLKVGGPYVMRILGDNVIELRNVMVGEVWICSGQSNMVWWVRETTNAKETIASSNDPMLRLLQVPWIASDKPESDINASWQACKPETVPDFTGVGYFFGKALRKALNVPVGLVNASVGATMAESWMSRDVLEADPEFKPILSVPIAPEYQLLRPVGLYNAMIHPLIPYAIRGVIWYQGESNATSAFGYRRVFPALIKSWRDEWSEGQFPFLFVQIAPYEFQKHGPEPQESWWAECRESQLMTSRTVPGTAMAVITDVGDITEIHPKNKKPVGERLALAARALAYGEKIVYSGPVYRSMKVRGGKAEVCFDHVHGGLVAKGSPLKGFAIAGPDKKFVWATAKIDGNKVIVTSPEVKKPVAVRYGWADCPDVNLYNAEDLPASPFRTDDFPMITRPKK